MASVELREKQREQLERTIGWARRIRAELAPVLEAHGTEVHFRPSSSGVALVGLLADRPQRGKGGITNLNSLSEGFAAMFETHCRAIEQGRVTGEKALQSYLIRDAAKHGGRLAALNEASALTREPVELWFVTDEISLPTERGKMVCDILALRRDAQRVTPVVIELKDSRQMRRLIEQLDGYAALIEQHADSFAELFGVLLGERLEFDGPTEKWIVWPAAGPGPETRTGLLRARGVRVVSYSRDGAAYLFQVGA